MYGMRTVDSVVPRGGVPPALPITIGLSPVCFCLCRKGAESRAGNLLNANLSALVLTASFDVIQHFRAGNEQGCARLSERAVEENRAGAGEPCLRRKSGLTEQGQRPQSES
jgi:hypothetical protein